MFCVKSWVACILIFLIIQTCRRIKDPNRYESSDRLYYIKLLTSTVTRGCLLYSWVFDNISFLLLCFIKYSFISITWNCSYFIFILYCNFKEFQTDDTFDIRREVWSNNFKRWFCVFKDACFENISITAIYLSNFILLFELNNYCQFLLLRLQHFHQFIQLLKQVIIQSHCKLKYSNINLLDVCRC